MPRPAFKFSSAQPTTIRFRELAPMVAALLFAAVFFCVGVNDAFKFIWFYTWEKVPCQLEKIEVVDDAAAEKPFSMAVSFHYEWQGRTYTSHEYGAPPEADYSTLKACRDAWLAAKSRNETFCRMNPGMPSEAVLETEGIRSGGIAFAVVGAMFLAMIGQVFWLALRGVRPQEEQTPRIALPFFLVIGTFGVGFLGGGLVLPALKFHQAKSWTQTKAEVIWSAVRERSGGKHTTYSPDIFYSYTMNGKAYRSNHGKLSSGFSEGYQDSLNIVKAHPPDSWFSCYVNPDAPEEVARDREWRWSNLGALFGLPFAVLGVWGTGWSVLQLWRKRRCLGN
jgi:hypothetical protein